MFRAQTMKRNSRPKSLREAYADSDKALNFYAVASGKTPVHKNVELPPKRERVKSDVRRASHVDLEGPVQSDISDLLAVHPKVLFAVRQNSGMMYSEYENKTTGEIKKSYTWFYKWTRRRGKKMRITDFWGMLTDGRMFAIEAKKPSWKKPTDDREREQWEFILTVKSGGGIGCFATCVEDVIHCLNR